MQQDYLVGTFSWSLVQQRWRACLCSRPTRYVSYVFAATTGRTAPRQLAS